jgi:acyl carrier protein
VGDRAQTVLAVRQIIMARWPHRFAPDELQEQSLLGDKGLGLDSIELAEVVLACEDLGCQRASAELFATEPLTIGRVAEHFCSPPA